MNKRTAYIVATFILTCTAAFAADIATAPADYWALIQQYLLTPAAISGFVGFLMAILPQGSGGVWGLVRSVLDFVAMNWGNAKNAPKA
jgi:uncharacterized membrane protein